MASFAEHVITHRFIIKFIIVIRAPVTTAAEIIITPVVFITIIHVVHLAFIYHHFSKTANNNINVMHGLKQNNAGVNQVKIATPVIPAGISDLIYFYPMITC